MKKLLCLCVALGLFLCLCSCKSSDYSDAMSLFEAGEYEKAIVIFEALGDYKDSVQKIADCERAIRYNEGMALMDAGNYDEAISVFESLDGYEDSTELIEKCNTAIMDGKYDDAVALMEHDPVQAFEALIALDKYKDSAQKADSIYEQYLSEKQKSVRVGETILFGSYEQDNNYANGREYIEWLVLEKKSNKMLVISKHGLDCRLYDEVKLSTIAWEACYLRKWMNDSFVNNAFSAADQSMISPKGQDKVFLLSLSEVYDYFDGDFSRECKPTAYALAKGVEIKDEDRGICWWWVRGDLYYNEQVAIFRDDSYVTWEWPWIGTRTIYNNVAVRPAMWMKMTR